MNNIRKQCYLCDSADVINQSCARCHRAYCKDCAFKIDPANYCDDCMLDISIEQKMYSKTTTEWEDWDKEDGGYLKTTGHKVKLIMFKGIDWMWACTRICAMPIEDLREAIEYHRAMVSRLANEIASRDVKRTHSAPEENAKHVFQIQQTVTKKVTRTAKLVDKTQRDAAKLVEIALKLGISSSSELQEFIARMRGPVPPTEEEKEKIQ